MRNQRNLLGWVVLTLGILAFLGLIPQLQGMYFSQDVPPREIPALVNEYRRTWAQIIGGFALLLGLYFTWRRVEISQRTLEATQDQQVTERFTRAIDQLGATENNSKQLEIRLGGIYALERIARDSEQDHWPIMEVLTAYVRQHSPRKHPEETREKGAAESEHAGSGLTRSSNVSVGRVLDADTQAIITVIRRRTRSLGQGEPESLDLHDTYLNKVNLREANLVGADLQGANLQKANLQKANLQKANLLEANLLEANLWRAYLRVAKLVGANFGGANLLEANLQGADLWKANLQGANLQEAMNLTQEQLELAVGNETTMLPKHLEAPASWLKQSGKKGEGPQA